MSTVLLFGVAHVVALCPARGASADFARCAELEDDAARLECYDALVREAVEKLAPAGVEPPESAEEESQVLPPNPSALEGASPPGEDELADLVRAMGGKVVQGWLYQETSDPVDGAASLVIMRPSDPGAGERAQLLIGCVAVRRPLQEAREDPIGGEHRFVTRVAVGWSTYLGSDTYSEVKYVVDGKPPTAVSLYADRQSFVAGGETALGLVRDLLFSERLEVWVTPSDVPDPLRAVFDLSGIDLAGEPLGRYCGW